MLWLQQIDLTFVDPAILRPGRFDRQIYVGIPNVKEREAILMVHTRNKRLDPDVDLKVMLNILLDLLQLILKTYVMKLHYYRLDII